jgi:serine/threonine protein kinase
MGSVLYEMLTGHLAFKGETALDTMIAVVTKDPPKIDLEQAGIPLPLREIVRHCLKKEPENRFQSARDLASALDIPSGASKRIIDHYQSIEQYKIIEKSQEFRDHYRTLVKKISVMKRRIWIRRRRIWLQQKRVSLKWAAAGVLLVATLLLVLWWRGLIFPSPVEAFLVVWSLSLLLGFLIRVLTGSDL